MSKLRAVRCQERWEFKMVGLRTDEIYGAYNGSNIWR